MKKLLSLLLAILMLVTIVGVAPTVFAEEAEYTMVDEVFGKTYWKEFYENPYNYSSGRTKIVKDGNWYYAFVKTVYIDEFLLYVCGYDGNESEITIPTEFDGKIVERIGEFYLFSTTVKTINIPKEIIYVMGASEARAYNSDYIERPFERQKPFIECAPNSKLEEIVVDNENKYYSSLEGVLFTKNFLRLVYYPVCKVDEKYVMPDAVKYISDGALSDAKNLKSLTITPNVEELGYDCIPENTLKELRFENVLLPEYVDLSGYEEGPSYYEARYVPEVPNATVYCIKDSPMYEYYDLYSFSPDVCKDLVSIPPLTETLIKEADGKWYYYYGDYKKNDSTLVKYKGKWFYVTNGVWDKTVTNKIISYKGKWFYIKNGKWDKSINSLIKIGGIWYYIKNGKLDSALENLVEYKGKWFYVIKGRWYKGEDGYVFTQTENFDTPDIDYYTEMPKSNTLYKKDGKWHAIKSGKWYKGKAIIKYKGKNFYVNKGYVQFKFSGKVKINGKTYKIKNGKVA